MNKKITLLVLALAVILLLSILIGIFTSGEETQVGVPGETSQTSDPDTSIPQQTTEELMDGIEEWEDLPTTQPTDATVETTAPAETTAPDETTEPDQEPESNDLAAQYARYLAMTPEEQQAFYESFASPDAFFAWYDSAKAAYEANQDVVDIQGGDVDLGDLMDGGNGG